MSDFYIKKISAKGSGKTDSFVELQPGLNIIQGRSNTGKTCIIKCIDFCLGSKNKPFDDSLGYDTIVLELHSGQGDITISRQIGKNKVEVITTVSGFDDGIYDLKPSKKKDPAPVLSDLLLAAIGITGEHKIIKNKDFDKRRLTWRTFQNLLLFHVGDIAKETSVIEPEQVTEKTAFFSSLLFLLSGNDFAKEDAKADKKIREAKRRAVEDYVNKKISDVAEKKKELEGALTVFDGVDVDKKMQELVESIDRTRQEIAEAAKQSKVLLRQIVELQDRATECEMLRSRYTALRSQYVSDVKRLSFIVNGEVELKKAPANKICPFCEGEITPKKKKSYISSARAELSRITAQMNGLSVTEQNLVQEQAEIDKQLKELTEQRESIESMISEELAPKEEAYTESLNKYRTYIQIKSEIGVITRFASSWEADLQQLPTGDEDAREFHPKEYFGDEFLERIDGMLKDALVECCYDNLTGVRFNMSDFDVEINGHKKADSHGQGYCSYLNSIIAMVFRQYLSSYATYDPGFIVIDTPLLGLDQGVSDAAPESMRTALFRYFTTHQDVGQVIILENIKHIPKLDYEGAGAKVITFTKGLEPGRYGFLADVQ